MGIELLKNHTTFKIGGKADLLYTPNSIVALKEIIKISKNLNWNITIIGNGSNLLVSDKGIRGIVIKICNALNGFKVSNNKIIAGSGILIKDLINISISFNLRGIECLCGIPATLGGCIYMNASYTKEIKHIIEWVKAIDYKGIEYKFTKEDLEWGYRKSLFHCKKFIITQACLKLEHGNCREIIEKYNLKRKRTQPIQFASAGSVFLNNNLKEFQGLKQGDAEVIKSFIVNKGNAKFNDVIRLIEKIKQNSSHEPTLEIEILGER